MKSGIIYFSLFLLSTAMATAQQNDWEYFITAHVNLYAPINSQTKIYPVLGYNKDVKPHILIGGFGAGFKALKQFSDHTSLSLQASASRVVYWDESLTLNENTNTTLAIISTSSADYSLAASGLAHHHFSSRFSVGAGAGVRGMVLSMLYFRDDNDLFEKRYIGRNAYYKPFMPYIPIELSYKLEKVFFTVRYEQTLLKKYKADLAEYKSDRYGLIFMEVGFKL